MEPFYSFLPYLRRGMTQFIDDVDPYTNATPGTGERTQIDINLSIDRISISGAGDPTSIAKNVALKGPGDVIGINSNAIVKVHPTDWTTNFPPNYLPYIEFYDEDFPWRYTPAKGDDSASNNEYRLRPWITLVTLEEGEFDDNGFDGRLQKITVKNQTSLPNPSDAWAWAHVHVNNKIRTTRNEGLEDLKGIINNDADRALSRIISSRRLKPNTGYHVFLMPTFEVGVLASQGLPTENVSGLKPAWDSSLSSSKQFPVYYRWFFKTGQSGDFESLVRLLKPKALNINSGKRPVDLQVPGFPTLDLTANPKVIGMEGVMKPPAMQSDDWDTIDTLPHTFTNELIEILNSPADYRDSVTNDPDPIIAPPIYGQWHGLVDRLSPSGTNWIHEANLDPRFRIMAGVGAEVLRQNQDKYMEIAWKQVGEVIEANRKIRQMQLSLNAGSAMHDKNIKTLSAEQLLNVSGPVHMKVKVAAQTVYGDLKDKVLPPSMFMRAFRRITRKGGPFMLSVDATGTTVTPETLIQKINAGNVIISPAYQKPVGQLSYTWFTPAQLTPTYTLSLSPQSNFTVTVPGSSIPTPVTGANSPQTQIFVNAVAALHNNITLLPAYTYVNKPTVNLPSTRNIIVSATDPATVISGMASNQIYLVAPNNHSNKLPTLDIVLAAPKIILPMYKELAKLSTEWLLPGLNNVPQNSVCVARAEQKYIEAYMLGLNHEMARELVWRGYPTDQRGTCFQFFWDYNSSIALSTQAGPINADAQADIKKIHEWYDVVGSNHILSDLGTNNAKVNYPATPLVLIIRGELLRRYPNAIIYLQKAEWDPNASNPIFADRIPTADLVANPLKYPIFSSKLEPDTYFLGFDADPDDLKGSRSVSSPDPGYFFVFQERVGELEFGADEIPNPLPTPPYPTEIDNWDALNWLNILANHEDRFMNLNATITIKSPVEFNNPDNIHWAQNSASVAYALHQKPARLFVHASRMILG